MLKEKVAVITGGGRGIGAAIGLCVAQAGGLVALAARTTSEINRVAHRIITLGGRALAVRCDISVAEEVRALISAAVDQFGRIDFLINCAATLGPLKLPVWSVAEAEWNQVFSTNINGPINLMRACVPGMIRQKCGRMLFLASPLGYRVIRGTSPYSSSRACVHHLVRILAEELEGTGVTANIVHPAVTETTMLKEFQSRFATGKHEIYRGQNAITPETSAILLLWLCSPQTEKLNGETISWYDPQVQWHLAKFRQTHLL